MEHPPQDVTVWVLGTAAVMTIAAINAFSWLLMFVLRADRQQTDDRHAQGNRCAVALDDVEQRLTRRIEAIEQRSIGWQRGERRDGEG